LKRMGLLSDFGRNIAHGGVWECPDFPDSSWGYWWIQMGYVSKY
jgi:hypothetical protein